jgi:hypothetical protein
VRKARSLRSSKGLHALSAASALCASGSPNSLDRARPCAHLIALGYRLGNWLRFVPSRLSHALTHLLVIGLKLSFRPRFTSTGAAATCVKLGRINNLPRGGTNLALFLNSLIWSAWIGPDGSKSPRPTALKTENGVLSRRSSWDMLRFQPRNDTAMLELCAPKRGTLAPLGWVAKDAWPQGGWASSATTRPRRPQIP